MHNKTLATIVNDAQIKQGHVLKHTMRNKQTARSHTIIRHLTTLCLTLIAMNVHAMAGRHFFTFKTSQGLSDNTVFCALRDSYGFMWFGTNDGLNRFDGTNNQVLRNYGAKENTPKNNSVYSLLEVGDDIWMGGNNGILIYHRRDGSFQHFNARTKYGVLIRSAITKMAHGKDSRIWIATLGQGHFVYDTANGSLTQDSHHGGFIEDMLVDSRGNVWQVAIDGQLFLYDGSGHFISSTQIPNFVNMKQPLCLSMVGNSLWVGCSQGLYRYDYKARKLNEVALKGLSSENITAILPQRGNRLLLGTDRGLMTCNAATGECKAMTDFPHLAHESIRTLLRDGDGTLWVMTDNEGVCYLPTRYDEFSFVSLPTDNANLLVNAFATTADGRLWLGTSHGLYSHDGKLKATGIRGNIQTLLAVGNTLYVGSRHDGLTVIDNNGQTTYNYSPNKPHTLASNNVQCLLRAHDNQIYVGTSWGVCRYDQATHNFYGYMINSMTSIQSLAEDRQGRIWCATASSGLVRIEPQNKAIVTYNSKAGDSHSLPSNNVIAVMCDKRGRLWVATNNGLCHYDEHHDNFHTVSVKSLAINFISEDNGGNLWMGADNGLLRYNSRTGAQALFDNLPEGWNANDARNAVFRNKTGEIYVGADGGFYHFRPAQLAQNSPVHRFHITNITFPWASNSAEEAKRLGVGGQLYVTREITLPYTDNSFTLHLSSPNYGNALRPQFEYQLKGYDKTWIKESDNADVTYSHVPPGSYTFLIRQADGSSVTSLKVEILPPWYMTIWAYLCYALAIALTLWLFIRWNRKSMRKKYEERMEQYKTEQEKLAFQSKISFFIDLVHEIRTPLSLISLPLQLLEKNPTAEESKQYISIMHKNVDYLFGVTNHLLDFQKMESGKIELKFSDRDVNSIVQDMYDQFAGYDKLRQMALTLQMPDEIIATSLDEDMIKKVLMNLLSNAQKYAKASITLRLERIDGDSLRISVIDDGNGVPDKDKAHIFDAYYQADGDNLARKMGTGLGLAFARGIAEDHGGKLYVVNAEGGGSDFRLELPIKTIANKHDKDKLDHIDNTPRLDDTQQLPETDDSAVTKKFTLMIVEDNAELLSLTAAQLRKWYRVVTAKNGVDAMQQLKSENVDLMVSDVMMPEMDGIELCRRLKQNINYSHIPVILLTAKTLVQSKEEGLEVGADIYLEKPFSIRQLYLQINNLLHMRQQFYERMQTLDKEKIPAKKSNDLGMSNDDYKFMKAMNEYLDANLADEDFSIGNLADQLNMSRSSFYRKLKTLTDMSPVDYTKHYRLDCAARMLREGKRVTEVLMDVGFTSSSYFAKCFKNQFGVLPKDYVKSLS